MATRHNLAAYEQAGLEWVHVPVDEDEAGIEELLAVLRRATRKPGAVALHANRYTDFVATVCARHLHELRGIPVRDALQAASDAGLTVAA
jgi:hypothetical protein